MPNRYYRFQNNNPEIPRIINPPWFYGENPKTLSAVIQCIQNIKPGDKIRYVNNSIGSYHFMPQDVYNSSQEYLIAGSYLAYIDVVAEYLFEGFDRLALFQINKAIINHNYIKQHLLLPVDDNYYISLKYFMNNYYPFIIYKK